MEPKMEGENVRWADDNVKRKAVRVRRRRGGVGVDVDVDG